MSRLTSEQGRCLLRLARAAIENRLGGDALYPEAQGDQLLEQGGTFVTLKQSGRLRGCIGNITPTGTVWDSVRSNAVNAAFFDHRFEEISREDLSGVTISVSVLTPAEELIYSDADDLCARLRPHVDGVILKKGRASATFLPQVWEQLPAVDQFLCHLCQKAGLTKDAWRDGDVEIQVYQVQNFSEDAE